MLVGLIMLTNQMEIQADIAITRNVNGFINFMVGSPFLWHPSANAIIQFSKTQSRKSALVTRRRKSHRNYAVARQPIWREMVRAAARIAFGIDPFQFGGMRPAGPRPVMASAIFPS